jgi:ubiquinone/menaquinone biosynthesis C-methylase UbiE
VHRVGLVRDGNLARCAACSDPYFIENEIWLLDSVGSKERTAFDEQVENDPVPLDLVKGDRHLQHSGIQFLENASILDVGCGLGDLTQGLAVSERLKNCDIYAFDHSIESVRRAAASVQPANGNRAHFSTQDAASLFFPDAGFDLIAGAAVLHHIRDYRALLQEVFRLLRPDGRAIFSEPFLDGYFWPSFLLQCAVRDLGLERLDACRFGLCRFILENTASRVRHAGDPEALAKLTDKHYFTTEGISKLAFALGYREVSFSNYDEPSFYDNWMAHFLDIYRITDAPLRNRAIELYSELRDYSGPALPSLVSHFRFIVLKK